MKLRKAATDGWCRRPLPSVLFRVVLRPPAAERGRGVRALMPTLRLHLEKFMFENSGDTIAQRHIDITLTNCAQGTHCSFYSVL